ncbi:succinate dehydrogenase assembly factor 4, mitochondrial-like [Hyposmocoma kahamanoa]|uniref:succinate dehydrogenase assembly factor 4, mitochondrial-like n=1 Tax=Hyposmocoma kahamanoa TaxID=1477025 RepID=UPI000E6D89DF|nr:succinate dehydrogenase assembly factor 4, mitochondrial-like [Hyposmocoma kahamanoa]
MLRMAVMSILRKVIANRPPLKVVITRSHSHIDNESSEAWGEDPNDHRPIHKPINPVKREDSKRIIELRKKLKEDIENPKEDIYSQNLLKYKRGKEEDPLPPWPENTNPHTGEVGGPKGPEPTRYGDWERKGICVDF